MIVIVIAGIIFGFGGNFFISFWREHRVSVQKDYLEREVRNAMDVIINGTMREGDPGEFYRSGGIISARAVDIKADNEIWLYGPNSDPNELMGRIFNYPPTNPSSLLFDEDEITNNGNERRLLPQGASDAPYQDPYTVEIAFKRDIDDPSLIGIDLELWQDTRGRDLRVKLHSAVYLRNY